MEGPPDPLYLYHISCPYSTPMGLPDPSRRGVTRWSPAGADSGERETPVDPACGLERSEGLAGAVRASPEGRATRQRASPLKVGVP